MNKITTEYEYLVHLVACAINDTVPCEKPDELDFSSVFEIGKIHEVANIAYLSVEKLENQPSDEFLEKWKNFYYNSIQRDVRQLQAYYDLINSLHSAGVRTTEGQGTRVKPLYPSTDLRMMSDIDIIIDRENLEKAKACLETLGYEAKYLNETEVDGTKGQIYIEIHSEFFEENIYDAETKYHLVVNNPFSHAKSEDDSLNYVLDDETFYLFSLLHTVEHYEVSGCGIRRVLDLYFLRKEYENRVDTKAIDDVLKKYGYYQDKEDLFALEKYWFEDVEPNKDLSNIEKDIISAGNHGTEEQFYRKRFEFEKESGKRFAKFKYFIRYVFPKKEYIYLAYPFCREHNYPTVLCWIHRIIVSTFKLSGFKNVMSKIKKINGNK